MKALHIFVGKTNTLIHTLNLFKESYMCMYVHVHCIHIHMYYIELCCMPKVIVVLVMLWPPKCRTNI